MPVVDRVNWLRHEVERGRQMHISYGASTRAGVLTVKVILRPLQYGICDGSLQSFQLIHLESLWRLVTTHHSADRGHKMSDGTSIVRFWATLDGSSNLDSINYMDSMPPPVPPPVLPMRGVDDSVDAYDHTVAECDRDIGMEVIDSQNHTIAALSEHVSVKIDMLTTALASLQNDIRTQFARSRDQVIAGFDGLDTSLDAYFHQPSTLRHSGLNHVSSGANTSSSMMVSSMLEADANMVASMCVSVPIDVASQCSILGGVAVDASAQTSDSYLAVRNYMDRDTTLSRVPADESDSDEELDELDHNIVMLGGSLLLSDPLFGKVAEELGEITGVYFDLDIEERVYEIEYGRRLYSSDNFEQSVLCDGVE